MMLIGPQSSRAFARLGAPRPPTMSGLSCTPACSGTSFCHGLVSPQCESTTFTQRLNLQCGEPMEDIDMTLQTLAAAEYACSTSSECSAIFDMDCDGISDGSDFYILCKDGGHITSNSGCLFEKPSPPPAPTPATTAPQGPCNPTNCPAPSFCHGTPAPAGARTCESLSWPKLTSRQCSEFLPHDTSLTTLSLAEAACGANDQCGGVSDYLCNGVLLTYPGDHYALCRGSANVYDRATCIFSKQPLPPPLPAPPPTPPAPAPCDMTNCPAPSFCHGTHGPGGPGRPGGLGGHGGAGGAGGGSSMTCESLAWPQSSDTQCVEFLPFNRSLTTLVLAEAECGPDAECGGVSDYLCNGVVSLHPGDHYALCRGSATRSNPAGTCVFLKGLAPSPPLSSLLLPPPLSAASPPSPQGTAPALPSSRSCLCSSDPASYSTVSDPVNCFGANDVTNLEVMFSGVTVDDITRAFYLRCADYDDDGAFRANDLTNMKRYYAGLLTVASHIAG
eukprot:5190228-Prymnesium_polylepis.2